MKSQPILSLFCMTVFLLSCSEDSGDPIPEEQFDINNAFAYQINNFNLDNQHSTVYLFDVVNETKRELISTEPFDEVAEWVGETLYFINDDELFSINADGTGYSSVHTFSESIILPTIAPDESFFAFEQRHESIFRTHLLSLDDFSELVILQDETARFGFPKWSSDSKYLAMRKYGSDGDQFNLESLIIYDVANESIFKTIPLVDEDDFEYVAWQPNGMQIAYGSDHGITVLNLDTDESTFIDLSASLEWGLEHIAFSTDGRYVSFLCVLNRAFKISELHVYDLQQNFETVNSSFPEMANVLWQSGTTILFNTDSEIYELDITNNSSTILVNVEEASGGNRVAGFKRF